MWVAIVLGLVAAGCGNPQTVPVTFGSGDRFVPEVADFLDDVGLYPSVAVDSEGTPFVAYFGFPAELERGEIAPVRPIGAPSVPGVFLASRNDGLWTRGAVAMEGPIPNVDVAFGPAEVPEVGSITPENVNGTAIAIDGSGGLHVAWAADTGVWYAENTGGSFTATLVQEVRPRLRVAGPLGAPALAVTSNGTPWLAYTLTTALGQEVTVTTPVGGAWSADVVATVPLRAGGEPPSRVAVGVTGTGRPVVVYANGSAVQAATRGGGEEGGWQYSTVDRSADAFGLSLSAAGGRLHVAYYARGEVRTAASAGGTSWRTDTVAPVGTGGSQDGRSTGTVADEAGTVFVAWYDPGPDSIQLASADDGGYTPIPVRSTEGGVLPAVAVSGDGSAAYVAWYAEESQDLMLGTYGEIGDLALAVTSPTPTGALTSQPSPGGECTTAQDGVVNVVAQGIAFDTGCIEVPAGRPFTIAFDNQDADIQHNVALYTDSSATTSLAPPGELITGPSTVDYRIPSQEPGTYFFRCDVHPTQMVGEFRVSGGGGTGGGGGGTAAVTTEVTAQGIAFDTGTITLNAGQESTIAFTNDDAGVQHNIAMFPSESDLANPLFRGDLITGPDTIDYTIPALDPGEFYFHCDVHPTQMTGTVVIQ
ncbi:MAG: cupredoxin domain-containing protein [Actinomycetota bacterium]